MLHYTGHPLVDVGVATITAYVDKRDPALLNEADLDQVADFIEQNYPMEPLKSFLGVAFTTNAWFNNPAFNRQPQKRFEYAGRLLRSYREGTPQLGERCVFTGEPAVAVAFSDKLVAGRAFRQHIPLLTGEGMVNFYPSGNAGLPVSGKALLCIQMFPMGCAKCGGRLLAVHSDNADLMYDLAHKFLHDNLRVLPLARAAGSTKMPEATMSARTLLIETLLEVEQRRRDEARDYRPCSVTAYHLTNSGQSSPMDPRNPPLEMYHLPLEMTDFLSQIVGPDYKAEWGAIAQRAWWLWQPRRTGKKGKEETGKERTRPRRNILYEDLFRLPGNAREFVRRHFLRIPVRTRSGDDPRRTYSLREETGLVSWKLTELFLRRVMAMNKDRIQRIRELGDSLAVYVSGQNDKRFFTAFFQPRYDYFRTALIRANLAHVQSGNPPLIMFDPYVEVFEEGNEMARPDWRLARDLVLIRMVERLNQQGWLGSHPEVISEVPEEPESLSSDAIIAQA